MATILTHPLFEGALSPEPIMTARAALIHRMARDLLKAGTFAHHGESIVTLVRAGHATFDVMTLIDDARQTAMQHAVAMEMAAG